MRIFLCLAVTAMSVAAFDAAAADRAGVAGIVVDGLVASSPANGSPLTCDGPGFSTQSRTMTIINSTNAPLAGVTCSITPAGGAFTITQAPPATLAVGATSEVTVACSLPAPGAPAATATLRCTFANVGMFLVFPITATGQVGAAGAGAVAVPASSAWSLALAVFAIGALALRRSTAAS